MITVPPTARLAITPAPNVVELECTTTVAFVGASVGVKVGSTVGVSVGATVGVSVGESVGVNVGVSVGASVGVKVGGAVVGVLVLRERHKYALVLESAVI